MSKIIILLIWIGLLAGCSIERIKDERDVVSYPLCERAKERVTDMQGMSFDLPDLFKQAPCSDWSSYDFNLRRAYLSASINSTVEYGNLTVIGAGGHQLLFKSAIFYSPTTHGWRNYISRGENALSPEFFLQRTIYDRHLNSGGASIIEFGFVDAWAGGALHPFSF